MNQMLKPLGTITNKAVLVRHSHIIPTITTNRAKTQAGESSLHLVHPACTPCHLSAEYVQMRPAGAPGRTHLTTIKTKLSTYDTCPVFQKKYNGSQPYQGTSYHIMASSYVMSDDSAGLFYMDLFCNTCADYNYAR